MNDESFTIRPGKTDLPGAGEAGASFAVLPWRAWDSPDARAAWDALAARAGTPNPFFESWYLLPGLARFDPRGRLQIAALRSGEEAAGLAPLQRAGRYGKHPLPHLAVWLHANAFLGAPLVAAGYEETFWEALLDWADRHASAALFLHAAALPLDAALTDALLAVGARQRRRVVLVHREERAMLASPLGPAAYLEHALPGKKRKELRRQQARLAEQGALAFVRRQDSEEIAGWIEQFLALEARGWKGSAGSALACAGETAGLFRTSMTAAAERGCLERLSLELDGQPIAMLATLISPPGAFSYKTAFDEHFARFSPGVLLQLENLALLERAGVRWADSCAAPDHPMIDSLWRERRVIGRYSIAIGGAARRALFGRIAAFELSRNPQGLT
ncbi:GNAT family N-acetyltransferase [Novosphingobium fuchskuhlense]|uniref:GNAT family N-acetyltransferase n=1 Tax=Novosphingobium fuchskuhlense TaxID=1117702 RepID=UPI000AFA0701|nr:GNAT family N-acetyltransferase [Novosphingobium fuchskuhlense]